MIKVIIYGLGSFAELMHYYLSKDEKYEVIAFCADENFITNNMLKNLPIVSIENLEYLYPTSHYKMLVAVGYSVMRNRKVMFDKAKSKYWMSLAQKSST